MQGDGRRKTAPEPSDAQMRAAVLKNKIKENNAEFLDEYMEYGRERAKRNVDTMLEIVRKHMEKTHATRKRSKRKQHKH